MNTEQQAYDRWIMTIKMPAVLLLLHYDTEGLGHTKFNIET